MTTREELTKQLSDLATEFERATRSTMPTEWPDVELTMPQLKALASLIDGQVRMGDIASQSGISHSAATAMIDRLVDKELVSRSHDEHDRRVVVCELTPAGRELLDRFWSVREDTLRKLAAKMSLEELETVVPAMKIMADAAARPPAEPAE